MKFVKRIQNLWKEIFSTKRIEEVSYPLSEVFTPTSSALLTYVDRPQIDRLIDRALEMPGMQIILYGHSGSGKSTLIKNLLKKHELHECKVSCLSETTFNSLISDTYDRLKLYETTETSCCLGTKSASEIKNDMVGSISSEYSTERSQKQELISSKRLGIQKLAEILGEKEILWIIEDFHKVSIQEREKLSEILKIFVDVANSHKKVKVIAIGAVNSAREILKLNAELTNRITEINVPLMTPEELESIIQKGEKLLNVDFGIIKKQIIGFSNSLASICHHLCYNICDNANIKSTTLIKKRFGEDDLKKALEDYVMLKSDTFKSIYDKAINDPDVKDIFEAFCRNKKSEMLLSEIKTTRNISKKHKNDLKHQLNRLTTTEFYEILRLDPSSGKYFFSDPFFKAYTTMVYSTLNKETTPIFKYDKLDANQLTIVLEVLDKNNNVVFRSVKNGKEQFKAEKIE